MEITIDKELKVCWPELALGVLSYQVEVVPSSPALLKRFEDTVQKLAGEYSLEAVAQNSHIAKTREAYKALGKHPTEYRNAAEAMLRRIAKGNGLYHINNVVEVNNLISVASGYSIGSYDESGIKGAVVLRHAPDGVHYPGIGKSSVNIGHLPVLYDDEGPFGNPTSDSRRAMIQEGKRNVFSVIYSFDGAAGMSPWLEKYEGLLKEFCGVRGVDCAICD